MITPQITTEVRARSGAAADRRTSSSLATPVRCVHFVAPQPSNADRNSPKSVPISAVVVRAENPCAAYSTTNMIADEPTSPTSTGLWPTISAGNMNWVMMKPANARPTTAMAPRHRATATTATMNRTAKAIIGPVRWKSANW